MSRRLRQLVILFALAATLLCIPASASAAWQWIPATYTGNAYARCTTSCARVEAFMWQGGAWYRVSVAASAELSVRPYATGWHWAEVNAGGGVTRTIAIRSSSLAAHVPDYLPGSILPIPARATVLTLSGLNFNVYNHMPKWFGGMFNRAPYAMNKIWYPASIASNSITVGVANLDAALKRTPGPKIVMAHSQGAQVASRWMREHANDPDAPSASSVTFVLTGNPLRATGGYIIGRKEIGGTTGRPTLTSTKWPIVDVARQDDGWAIWPTNPNDSAAIAKAKRGKNTVHLDYGPIDLTSAGNAVSVAGNTTFVTTP